ncbi:fasciclin domain-containing protein [Blastococcus sp. CT_GayMR16]|uniref:fasciclin domain-containing protein n=1 Tax=Blastococcus sp. CT_GayMR16 TaxID=2559607 RepID=UPI001FD7778D|nr:fasciclin domain-containing protein [Blastococcus sp. CT_GayMR16]
MKTTLPGRGVLVAAVSTLAVTLSACGSDEPSDGSASSGSAATASETAESTAPAAAAGPFGPGCAAVPADGPGSFAGMAAAPVAAAASANPALSALVQAVTAANLGDSLNTQQNITVLAPANPAFEAIPADALQALLADSAQLTAVLTHHVIQGRLTPEQLAGTHTTLNNDEVTIEGAGQSFTIPGEGTIAGTDASVICGNVPTANATVYVIDQVLTPAG